MYHLPTYCKRSKESPLQSLLIAANTCILVCIPIIVSTFSGILVFTSRDLNLTGPAAMFEHAKQSSLAKVFMRYSLETTSVRNRSRKPNTLYSLNNYFKLWINLFYYVIIKTEVSNYSEDTIELSC